MSEKFENAAFSALRQYNMLDRVTCVTVALSGGADSMSLLHFLSRNKQKLNITVTAAHINHCIRGQEALRDEQFVKAECEKLGVELCIKRVDIPALAKEKHIGLEECGRQERYAFFEELRGRFPSSVTATAHTASDNAETVLLNITRGSGLDGLCGIPPVRSGIIRPLINCTRADIESYCRDNLISYITDSTNLCDNYSRNRIRLNVLPQLEMINPAAAAAVNRLSSLARADCEMIDKISVRELESCRLENGLSREKLLSLDTALSVRVIKKYISERFDIVPEKRQLDLLAGYLSDGHGAVELRKDIFASVKNGVLTVQKTSANMPINLSTFTEMPFSGGISFEYNGKHYEISDKKTDNSDNEHKINKKLLINRISCGIISCDTVLRCRKSGDHFTQLGRGCTKSVKKLFSELKLPAEERAARLLVANGSEVLWIEGVGVSQSAAVPGDGPFFEIKAGC